MGKFSGRWNEINDYRKQLKNVINLKSGTTIIPSTAIKEMQASVFSNAEQWKCFILLIPKSAQIQIVGTIIQHFG